MKEFGISLPIHRVQRTPREQSFFEGPITAPQSRHTQLFLIMKATRLCNLRCTYCNAWREGPNQIMSAETMLRATEQVLKLAWVRRVDFVWHGGETTLLPISFFEAAIAAQRQHQGTRIVTNNIQTNATLLNNEWINLFKEGNFSVGVSLDPPPERHARKRITKGGRNSWLDTLDGIRQLREAGIEHGVLIVVTSELVDYGAQRFLACLDEHEITKVALLNVLPDNRSVVKDTENYLDWSRFVQFLIEVYVERESRYKGRIRIRELDSLITSVNGGKPQVCVLAGNCMGQFLTVEPTGHVSACDKYINDKEYTFGNIFTQDLDAMLSDRRLAAVQKEYLGRIDEMTTCPYYEYCHGGCPHDQYLMRKLQPDRRIECCGLRPLIDVIRDRQVTKHDQPS